MPFPLLAFGIGALVGGTILDIYGRNKSAAAANTAAKSAAAQHEFNARVADLQAEDALLRGAEQEQQFRTQVRQLIGRQRAGYAAQGVDVGVGSPVDVAGDTAYLGELDALTARNNAMREAWGYRVEAEDRRKAADVARKGGQAALTAARWGTASTILGAGLQGTSLLAQKYGW